jgi:hypothetical protein
MDCDGDISTNNVCLSGRVGPGDLITVSFYVMQSNATSGTLTTQIICLGDAPGAPSPSGGSVSLNTSSISDSAYQLVTLSMICPQVITFWNPTGFFFTRISQGFSFGNSNNIDMDDFTVQVMQAGTEFILCVQASTITIDNSTTETDFL